MSKKEVSKEILGRLKKLIRLQKGALKVGSVGEAEAAALAIGRLLTEYNLSLADVEGSGDDEAQTVEIVEGDTIRLVTGDDFRFSQFLLSVITRYNYCQVIFADLGRSRPSARIVGSEINTETCFFLYEFLSRWFKYHAGHEANRRALDPSRKRHIRESFLYGCIEGVEEKFKAEQTEQITALVISHKAMIEKYIKNKQMNFKRVNNINNRKRLDTGAYLGGRECGRSVQIRKRLDNCGGTGFNGLIN
jgi:hypothetical protein